MKKIYIALIGFFSLALNAQVGINTDTPTRTLDVNGNLRIRETENKNLDPDYNKVLVTNANGEIEFWDKANLQQRINDIYTEGKKNTVSSLTTDRTKKIKCGKFEFGYSDSSTLIPQIRLATAPKSNVTVYYNRIRERNNSGSVFTLETGRSLITNQSFIFGTANNFANIGGSVNGDTTGNYNVDTLDVYYISYPGDANIYRVTFLARRANSTASNVNYSMICEIF